jgi:ribosomal protein S12 methylthiotransferase
MKKIALISLGCAKNLVDSEVMLGVLAKNKYKFVQETDSADIIIINTCGFILPARQEAQDTIEKAILEKRKKKEKKIIVAGCYVQRNLAGLREAYPEVDAWTGVSDFDKIARIVEGKSYESASDCFLYDHTSPRLISTPPAWAYVKISEGCSKFCSFCTIPSIKGPYKSRTVSSIIEEVSGLVQQGIKEVNLISQDTTYFGHDNRQKDGLARLLEELLKIEKLGWIRILYSYPEEVTDSLLEIMREERLCSYLDIPFQHSHPQIIKKMKRGWDRKRSLEFLERARNRIPDVAVRTSLIVGFPGEGKLEFDDLKSFVTQARFDHLGVFTYSSEEDTPSFRLGDPVKKSVKQSRKNAIMGIQAELSYENNEKYVGRDMDILIEGTLKQDHSLMVGRSQYQAPEVDGIVFIDAEDAKKEVINTIQKVEITDRDVYDLYGRLKQ